MVRKKRTSRPTRTKAPETPQTGVNNEVFTGGSLTRWADSGALQGGGGGDGQEPHRESKEFLARAKRYFKLYIYLILVYGGLLMTDYIIFFLVSVLLHEEIAAHRVVALFFNFLRVGLALFVMLGVFIHGLLSLVTLIRLDLAISRKLEENEST
jgi:hypothetical protein